MKLDTLLGTGCCQFFHNISFKRGGFDYVIIRILSIKHRKTFVMTASETDIFGSRSFNSLHPFIRIKLGRIKSTCQFGILFIIQIIICHSPLTGGKHGIQSPMKENTEFIILKFFTGFEVFFTRLVRRLCVEPGGDSQTHTY